MIEIVPDQIVTRRSVRSVRRRLGQWVFDPERDILLIASIERHKASGRIGLGLVSGFGLTHDGALGSSVAHDSHNLIIAGTNAADMLICARVLAEHGGGFVAVADGAVRAVVPLPVAGLLSLESAETVCRQLDEINRRRPRPRMPARGAVRNAFVPGAAGHSRAADHDPRRLRRRQAGIRHAVKSRGFLPDVRFENTWKDTPAWRTDPPATQTEKGASVESVAPGDHGHSNADLAPTNPSDRHWGTKDFAALWVSMSACIPTYTLASSLIEEGMNWWQAVVTIFLGNLIVLVPMVLNAHAGTKYGIPFPVYCRASFGILGANVPALLRALVACGWFGIQSWIGGWAIYKILAIYVPSWEHLAPIPLAGYQRRPARLLSGILGDQHGGDLSRHRFDPIAC